MQRRHFALHQPAALALAAWAGCAQAQARFKLQTPTVLQPTTLNWSFVALANGDLAAVQRRGTQGKTEVHIVAAADNYQRFALQTETALSATIDNWDFVALPNRDIAGISRVGSNGQTEIHVLDASKGYKSFRLQIATALPAADRRWSFGVNGDADLVAICRLGASGRTEIHVLDAARKYARFRLQIDSALHATDSTWDFGVMDNGDVVAIARQGESGRTELHVLDAAKDYKRFKYQAPSPLQTADEGWKFAVRGNGDVMAVLTRGGATGRTEVHVFGSSKS